MSIKGRDNDGGSGQASEPFVCSDPLELLAEEHLRERSICALIDAIADAPAPDRAAIATVLEFLATRLPAHVQDEVVRFFPVLRERCSADDEIGPVIDAVVAEHELTMNAVPMLFRTLDRCLATGTGCTEADCALLHDFAAHVRRHVVVVNAILLPIARARLSQADLAMLGKSMLGEHTSTTVGAHDAG